MNKNWRFNAVCSEREDRRTTDATAASDDKHDETRRQQGHGSHLHCSAQTRDESRREKYHKV